MEDREWLDLEPAMPAWIENELEALGRSSILLVEDDDDIRELLVTLLRLAGYTPQACRSAEEALEHLREEQFDLVLTDYMLPNRSGGWLLQQAFDEGLLEATPALVITAHPNPRDIQGAEVVQKPFDLDDLVDRVRRRLEGEAPSKPAAAKKGGPPKSANDGDDGCPDPIELILYVSSLSPHSATALENIRKALSRYKSAEVKLTIHDLAKDPTQGVIDQVAFTPTLVKRSPGPRTFILGHLNNPDLLLEMLASCEES